MRGPRVTGKRVRGRVALTAQVRQEFIDRYALDSAERTAAVRFLHSELQTDAEDAKITESSRSLYELRWLTEDEWKKQQRQAVA